MSLELNQWVGAGNLGRDAELKYTPNGAPYVNLTLANNRTVKGDKRTTWVRATWFGELAEKLSPNLVKGTLVIVTGPIELREYQASDGTTKQSLEVLVNNLQLVPTGRQEDAEAPKAKAAAKPKAAKVEEEEDDDVPF